MSTIDSDMLRSLVREALRDALPAMKSQQGQHAPARESAVTQVVSLNSDAELAAFVQRVLDLAEDPTTRAQLRSGVISYQLAGTSTASHGATQGHSGMRVDKGALTESMVRKAAESGNVIYLGRKAVVTSLARDKARAMGVELIRDKQEGTVNR